MKKKFLPYGTQSITEQDIQSVSEVLKSEYITRGPLVEEFEKAIASYCNASYAVAFQSGTAALMGACHAANVGPYDRLITTPNTFVATVGAGMLKGATPVFVDIDLETGCLNLDQVGYNLDVPKTRGKDVVIPVHFSGISVDMQRLEKMIKNSETVVIEDAAHAIGSYHPGEAKVGSCQYSDMTIFSFHPVKTMTTGEGGCVTTNNEDYYHLLKLFRNNGIERDPARLEESAKPWYYEVKEITGNYNFTDFQAALGISQLKRLDQMITKRQQLVSFYRKQLANDERIKTFTNQFDSLTAFHLFVVQIDFQAHHTSREELMEKLMKEGIGTQLHYIPVYRHPFFKAKHGDISEYFPNMEKYYLEALSLPLFYDMDLEDVKRVVSALKSTIS